MVSVLERIAHASGVDEELAAIAERVKAGVTLIRGRQGMGSGIIWDADGVIVTNNHVVASDEVEVSLEDGQKFRGTVTARDPRHDLARVEVKAAGLPALELGDDTQLKVGQIVLAVGNPHGIRGVATMGMISTLGVKGTPGPGARRRGRRDLIQAHLVLAPGNSGGALTDVEGRVLGINAMVGGPRVALAVPVSVAKRFMAGQATPGARMGIMSQLAEIPAIFRDAGVLQEAGIILVGVEENSPAERAGLYPGDVLLELDGEALDNQDALFEVLDNHTPGVPLKVTLLRAGVVRGFTVIPDAA